MLVLTQNALYISIVVYAVKLGKAMIGGKVRFHLVGQTTTLGRLILNGMQLQFMVSRLFLCMRCSNLCITKHPTHIAFVLLKFLAWAHLILYGEEATKKAEKEGEEAVAIWEQEQKDIAEGKIVVGDKSNKKVQPMVKKAGTGIKAELKSKMPGRKTPVKKDTNKAMTKRKVSLRFTRLLWS